jgi:nitrite reductase/ring-hydroxylating ferredoxin subunit
MLTTEQITALRQTAKRTPMGDYLRRFWHPVAAAVDLNGETRAKRVRVLSQPLVLFKDLAGRAALVPERCPHEGASMLMGAITEHGITCILHGWRFDTEQMCSIWDDDTVWAEGYPAVEHAGFYWAYLGDSPAPPLPDLPSPGRIVLFPLQRSNWLLDVAPRLPAGHTWLLTPADREQTMVFALAPAENSNAGTDAPVVTTETDLVLEGDGATSIAAEILAPWGARIEEGSPISAVYDQVAGEISTT